MQSGSATRVIAACLGLCGFTIAIVAGMYAGNGADAVIGRAIAALVICQVVGLFVGMGVESVVRERVRSGAAEAMKDVSVEAATTR